MAAFNGWAAGLLHAIGAPVTPENLRALNAWQAAEGGGASFNPLNTTQGARGASSYNGVGVKNYGSAAQGLVATAQTLLNGHYTDIVHLLRSGKATAPQIATAVGHSPWGTSGGTILRVLGSGPQAYPSAGSSNGRTPGSEPGSGGSTPSPAASSNAAALRQMSAAYLLEAGQNQLNGQQEGGGGLLGLALARKQLQAAQQAHGPMAAPQPHQYITAPSGQRGSVAFLGDMQGLNGAFVQKLQGAASAIGATKIKVTSGYRSPQHNTAVGGVPNSNHLTGHAMDGEAFIPGRGWVPLGVALKGVAGKFGLRSGDSPGFFNGGVDLVHVDDGFNQH